MDPISIATASVHLVSACGRLSAYIYTFIKKVQTVDTAVQVLDIEINSLSQVLGSIATSFSDSLVSSVALEAQTGHEGQYWQTVKRSMDDCKDTLARLEQILEKVGKSESGNFFRRSSKHVNLSMNLRDIDLLKQQVTAYRQTMQLALQMISVSSGLSNHADISAKLDGLTGNVDELLRYFRLLSQKMTQGNHSPQIVSNMEICVRSAGKLVSTAATIVSSRSQRGNQSVSGEALTAQQRTQIELWIPEPTISEEGTPTATPTEITEDSESLSQSTSPATSTQPTNSRTGLAATLSHRVSQITVQEPSAKFDNPLTQRWLASGREKFRKKDYANAEQLLQRMLRSADATYKTHWKRRDEVLRMLAVSYCQLDLWEEATLVLEEEFEGKDKIMEFYAKRAYWNGSYEESAEVLVRLIQSCAADQGELVEMRLAQALAEVKFATEEFDEALELCLKVTAGRKQMLGSRHVLYFQSINLLTWIYQVKKDSVENARLQRLLPERFLGCARIEQLDRLHPNEAAEQAKSYYNVRLPEILDNIQKSGRGVIGSGYGWNLLHHCSSVGDLLGIELLLEKGCDPTGSPDNDYGYYPLHVAAYGGKEDIVQVLLEKGATVDVKDRDGATPLMKATEKDYPTIVELLLYWGADVEARDNGGWTAWGRVRWTMGHKEVKQLLQQAKKEAAGKSK